MACNTEGATGYPGSNGTIPHDNGFLSEILLQHGYSTFAIGKWHLTPAHEMSAAGPYDRWPLGRGFQRFYGFLGGDLAQAAIGGEVIESGLLAAWIGWLTILWNIAWLIVLSVISRRDMYYPILHYVMPLVIGIACCGAYRNCNMWSLPG